MSKKTTVGIIVGSARRGSFNKAIADYFAKNLPENFEAEFIRIDNLKLYNQDYDSDNQTPEEWTEFRNKIKSKDSFLFFSPEYNRSITPILKNALDIGSRPYGQNVWGKKPGAVISASVGSMGGFGANHHLRQVLSYLDVYTMQQPEAYIKEANKIFDDMGNVKDAGTKDFLDLLIKSFVDWVNIFVE